MSISVGKMDRRVDLGRVVPTTDSFGQVIKEKQGGTPVTYSSPWANVVEMRHDEKFNSGRELRVKTAKFTIRHVAGIEQTDTITYEGQVWDILGWTEIGRDCFLEILAEQRK